MRHLSSVLLFAFAFLLIHTTYGNTLKLAETNSIFSQVNTDNDSTLEGEEIQAALVDAATKIFENSKFFKDEGLIKELAKEYSKELKSELNQEDFKKATDKLYKYAKNFREETYKGILRQFEMTEVLNDPELLEEVMRSPDTYGITYGSHKDVFDELEKVYKETAETIQDIQKQFQELLDKEKQGNIGDKVTLRQLSEVKEGVHKVQEGAQEVGHKVQEGVHAGVHRVQEGVQETVNTVKEKVEEVQHRVEETKDKAETKAQATVDAAKGAVHGDNAAQNAANQAKETVGDVKNTVKEGAHKVEEVVHAAGHTVQEGVQHGANKVDETVEKVKNRVDETSTKAGHRAEEAKEKLQENVQNTAENVKAKAQDAADAVKEGLHIHREKSFAEKLQDAVGEHVSAGIGKLKQVLGLHEPTLGDKAQDAVHNAKDKLKEGVDKLKEKVSGDDSEL